MAAADDPVSREWVAGLPLARHADALLAWVGAGRAVTDPAQQCAASCELRAAVGVADDAPPGSAWRSWRPSVLWAAAQVTGLIEVDDVHVRPGPLAAAWVRGSGSSRVRAHLALAVAHFHLALDLPPVPESWMDGAARLLVADGVCAAAQGRTVDDEVLADLARDRFGRRGDGPLSRSRALRAELQALGLLDQGSSLAVTGPRRLVAAAVAALLTETPMARPPSPWSGGDGPSFVIDVHVRGASPPRWRRLRVGGHVSAGTVTVLAAACFGLDVGDHEPGHLMSRDDDPTDPWALRIGHPDEGDDGPVVPARVSIASVVTHLGAVLTQHLDLTGQAGRCAGVDLDLRLWLDGDSPAAPSPACVGGAGDDLDGAPFDGPSRDALLGLEWR